MADLFEYYVAQGLSPTHASWVVDSELQAYEVLRRMMFLRLHFPPGLVAGKRLLEFGPDTGENSLVFAQWGARLTLAEPNPQAHAAVRGYFGKFHLESQLEGLQQSTLLDFSCAQRFDIIDAEGFIYTIRPRSAWIGKCSDCLNPGGFLIISYMERYGSFLELLLKAAYRRVTDDSSYVSGIDTARLLFQPKWDSVQHTRKIESWFMDVVVNPFVRLKYFLDPSDLLPEMLAAGFRLYSSWPTYRDLLAVHWIKKSYHEGEDLRSSMAFVDSRRLSHFLGVKSPMTSSAVATSLDSLVGIADALCDESSGILCNEARGHLADVLNAVNGDAVSEPVLRMCQTLFGLMETGSADALIEFCRNDSVFLSAWGTPAHYAVFQYEPKSPV